MWDETAWNNAKSQWQTNSAKWNKGGNFAQVDTDASHRDVLSDGIGHHENKTEDEQNSTAD